MTATEPALVWQRYSDAGNSLHVVRLIYFVELVSRSFAAANTTLCFLQHKRAFQGRLIVGEKEEMLTGPLDAGLRLFEMLLR